jgi:hypothetical protein
MIAKLLFPLFGLFCRLVVLLFWFGAFLLGLLLVCLPAVFLFWFLLA